jgi:hypothetical protein
VQIRTGKFLSPEFIMLRRIEIDDFVWTAMHCEVGLLVSIQIEAPQPHWTCDWLLEDARRHLLSEPGYLARPAHVYGDEFHIRWSGQRAFDVGIREKGDTNRP